jgi:3-(3-hydroxy-phenyl)propionate hydroxylase
MASQSDVLIIGAGPVGMTVANELVRHGVRPRIIDKSSGIREVSKALILHVRTQEVLEKVGIADRAAAEGQPLREVVVHAYGKHVGSWDLDDIDSPHPHPIILGQNRTQHALEDLLTKRGMAVSWRTEAIEFEPHAGGATVRVRTEDGQEDDIRARFVVGAEGSNSLVRRTLGFTFEGERYTGEQFIQADCRIRWDLPKGRSYLFLTAAGYLMVIEMPDDMVRIFISLPDTPTSAGSKDAAHQLGAVEAMSEEPSLDDIRTNLVRLTGFDCVLSDATWKARYRTSHRYANRFSQGTAFIAGDAAHVHVPIGGQGMNTGIQDGFNLGWKLAGVVRGMLKPEVLDSYHAERHPVAESLIRGTDFAYTGILHPGELRQRAARLFGPYLIRSGRVQEFMRSTLEELRISYPDSPLNLDLGHTRGPKPGERVVDADLVLASDGSTTSIARLTQTAAWTLFLFWGLGGEHQTEAATLRKAIGGRYAGRIIVFDVLAEGPAPNPAEGVLLDRLHIAHDRYGVSGAAFYLLRPDTYIAARGPLTMTPRLLAHLETIFA